LLIIPVVALVIDRFLFLIQRQLFPYQYGGFGILRRALGFCLRCWEDFKSMFRNPVDYNAVNPSHISAAPENKAG
jgi:hypothetical protein